MTNSNLTILDFSSQCDWEEKNKPRLVSLFSGCGGLDLPFHKAGFECVWAIDANKDACRTYTRNIADVIVHGKIEEVDSNKIPDSDIIIGGFPCQDFSMIWKRPGLDGTRGNLYTYFLSFVKAKQPRAFVAENVKGLLSANEHKAIARIISDFEEINPGYLVKPKLYNFAEYGVPQFRERVIIVGVRMDTGFNFIHPKPEYGPGRKYPFVTVGEALKDVQKVLYNNEAMKIAPKTVEILKLIPPGGNFANISKDNPLYVRGMISHVYRRIDPGKPSATLIAAGGGGTWGYHYPEPRALTNRERARLQTFPDDFIFEGSFSEVRRQIGNAVPPRGMIPVVEALLPLFTGNYRKSDLYGLDRELRRIPIHKRLKLAADENGNEPTELSLSCFEGVHEQHSADSDCTSRPPWTCEERNLSSETQNLKVNEFNIRVIEWHSTNSRHFPWRDRSDLYSLLVAELLLQKTNADKVVPAYSEIIKRYPIPEKLSRARTKTLQKIVAPLGLIKRTKTLKSVAEQITNINNANIDLNHLLSIKGVGEYMARSVLIHSKGVRLALLDPNFLRVYGRIFGLSSTHSRPRCDKNLWERAYAFFPIIKVSNYVYAMLDFAALVCRVSKPKCSSCPMFPDVCQGVESTQARTKPYE